MTTRIPSAVSRAVRVLPPFTALATGAFECLLAHARVKSVLPHTTLIAQGDPVSDLHVLLEGCAELRASAGTRESTLAVLRPGDRFVLAAVVLAVPSPVSARARAPSRMLLMPADTVRAALDADAEFARSVARELAVRCGELVAAHVDIKMHSTLERLAVQLLRYDAEQGRTGSLELPCDKRTLASLLTMTPETLSRLLKSLRPYGVTVRGSTIELADAAALEALITPPAAPG